MKRLLAGVLVLFLWGLPVTLFAEEDITVAIRKAPTQEDWISVISSNSAEITRQLSAIDKGASQEVIEAVIRDALNKVQIMRERLKKEGVKVEGFSLDISSPPALTLNCKFDE